MSFARSKELTEDERAELSERRSLRAISLGKLAGLGLLDTSLTIDPRKISLEYVPTEIAVQVSSSTLTYAGEFFCRQIGLWPEGHRSLFRPRAK